TIASAGGGFAPGATFPSPFLAGLPAADAERLGARLEVPAILGTPLGVRADDIVRLRGFDPLLADGWDDVDLSLRLGAYRPGQVVVATGSVVRQVRMTQSRSRGPTEEPVLGERIFRERWTGRVPAGDDSLWRSAGFEVLDDRVGGDLPVSAELVRPVLRWLGQPAASAREVGSAGSFGAPERPVLRWAIKTSIPADARGQSWGDLFFAQLLADALRRLGQVVAIDAREAVDRESAAHDDVVLVLRGLEAVVPHPGKVNLLWVISHPELVRPAELAGFDHVFAASTSWAEQVAAGGQDRVTALLQATDPLRFRPEVAIPDTGHRVLFVGNSRREIYRPSVRHLIEAGVDVAIYGRGWEQFVDPSHIKGQQIPNERLAVAYRSAGVVLNDHWEDMRESGFMSNRLFDAVAAGARVISDDIAGSEEIFGAAVLTYRTPEELIRLATSPVKELFPADERLLEVSRRVRSEHSFDRRAAVLLETALKLRGAARARAMGTR
ncbi:MAG TPA: glycosyltransferase, partial [Actinomycetes bacterium]|nr:glycosyltransferase [Actinomycetes bacterium]